MGNALFAYPISDDATITTGSEASGLPASNLLTSQPGDKWRATDLNNAYVVLDLGSALEFDLIWLGYTNASSAAQWRVRAAATEAGLTSAPDYDSGTVGFWPQTGLGDWSFTHGFIHLSTSETRRWVRIDVSDTGNGDGYFQAGRLYLSKGWQPATNVSFGFAVGFVDLGEKGRAGGGQLYAVDRELPRIWQATLGFMTETEAHDNLFDLIRRRRSSRDVLVIKDPAASDHVMENMVYGLMAQPRPAVHRAFGIFENRFEVEEML